MISLPWSQNETSLLLTALKEGKSYSDIRNSIELRVAAKEPGFLTARSTSAIRRKIDRISPTLDAPLKPDSHSVDKRWTKIKELQKQYNKDSKFLKVGLPKDKPTVKILSLSDIHFPFARMDFLNEAITKHSDADVVVLNGDILDGYAFSTFDKDSAVAAIDEYNCAFEFIDQLRKSFESIVLTQGNHDIRSIKAVKKLGLNDSASSVFELDLLSRIANGERLDRNGRVIEKLDFSNVFYPPTEKWWVHIGKTLFIHPHNRGSSRPGWTVAEWLKKFLQRLPSDSFDSVVCGHTHALSSAIFCNKLIIEQGCLCDYMAYAWQPREIIHSNAVNGYAIIYQDQYGNTDFNLSTPVYLGQLLPINKPIL